MRLLRSLLLCDGTANPDQVKQLSSCPGLCGSDETGAFELVSGLKEHYQSRGEVGPPPSHLSRPIFSSLSRLRHTDTGCDRSFYLPQPSIKTTPLSPQEVTHRITCHSASSPFHTS